MASKTETALVPLSEYKLIKAGLHDVLEAMAENFDPGEFNVLNLATYKVGTGGATTWPDSGGRDTLEGIIIHRQKRRQLWPAGPLGASVPLCSSADGRTGIGTPGGTCATCTMNVFGTAPERDGRPSRGKACKEQRWLYFLEPETLLPRVVRIPATSLRSLDDYLVQLATEGRPYWSLASYVKLEQDRTKDGAYTYSKAVFEAGPSLSEADRAIVRSVRTGLVPFLDQLPTQPGIVQSAQPVRSGDRLIDPETGEILEDDEVPA